MRNNLKNIKKVHLHLDKQKAIENIFLKKNNILIIADIFFKKNQSHDLIKFILNNNKSANKIHFYDTTKEPTTNIVDDFMKNLREDLNFVPDCILGIGGGSTLDFAKAVSNLYTNKGPAKNYQGWDLLKKKGLYKIGIPTISGTGSESTKTCILTDKFTNSKMGMNSEFSVFDEIILDHTLTFTVPKDQRFYTAMDTYIHSIESLNGYYRNTLGDSFSQKALDLFTETISYDDLSCEKSCEKMMIASYLGGLGISMGYVGLIHPLSAALSVVYDYHHCVANCIVMRAMKNFYPSEYDFFWNYVEKKNIPIPKKICVDLEKNLPNLISATLVHEKPLANALGEDYRKKLNNENFYKIFQDM